MASDRRPAGKTPEVLSPKLTLANVTDRLGDLTLRQRAPRSWYIGFFLATLGFIAFLYALITVFSVAVGLQGMNIPVAWGMPIINTIWWIGIAHAGTLISAVLLLTRQDWRAGINRFAEAMAMFAIVIAGVYPLLHLGRPWFFYWIFPYPNTMELWPQWHSPLDWDFYAIGTYMIFTTCFMYLSLLPDLGMLRDRAHTRFTQLFYGILALGWRNSARHWARYKQAELVFAAIAIPIVVAVTGTISTDLSVSIVPGYHFTIFPPYFVSGAIYSGFATVAILAVVLRWMFNLEDFITPKHMDYIGRCMLPFVLIVDYAYCCEMWTAFFSGKDYYHNVYFDRWFGPYAPIWWSMILCNMFIAQLLWFKRVRTSFKAMLFMGIIGDLGMWLERFQIVVTSTHAGYMPSAWGQEWTSSWDWVLFGGAICVFFMLMLMFVRLVPMISVHDMKDLINRYKDRQHG
jgi:molybdopterin-containing oxidoreductase family membrane subunit